MRQATERRAVTFNTLAKFGHDPNKRQSKIFPHCHVSRPHTLPLTTSGVPVSATRFLKTATATVRSTASGSGACTCPTATSEPRVVLDVDGPQSGFCRVEARAGDAADWRTVVQGRTFDLGSSAADVGTRLHGTYARWSWRDDGVYGEGVDGGGVAAEKNGAFLGCVCVFCGRLVDVWCVEN